MSEETDCIASLEERAEALIAALEAARSEAGRLRKRNAELEPVAKEIKGLSDQNKKLAAQVAKLEGEIRALGEKEGQVKDRLQGILEKIDRMEEALAGQAAAD